MSLTGVGVLSRSQIKPPSYFNSSAIRNPSSPTPSVQPAPATTAIAATPLSGLTVPQLRIIQPSSPGRAHSPQPQYLERASMHSKLPGRTPWIFCTDANWVDSKVARCWALEQAGARIVPVVPDTDGHLSMDTMLSTLHAEGIHSLTVEGGAAIIRSFRRTTVMDTVVITVAPMIVGEGAVGYDVDVIVHVIPMRCTSLDNLHAEPTTPTSGYAEI
ncbi:hypothetical protein FISHEDRAFT_68853 [Fistulina hepatica ATCC 64428]|uniref:2,5-diamino-6-ribosylamino-4(3H)-pyrimidinone 5'-phosphate reductase n=1 Tax=Fistulina hepatica ATCC 64428 TaxID=1128425 RepID=A0A0D7AQA5_9AGAR|nr:hypothetical protein FISHEDRAFT_68853 [Fistulina hepatica ATCC 64428]